MSWPGSPASPKAFRRGARKGDSTIAMALAGPAFVTFTAAPSAQEKVHRSQAPRAIAAVRSPDEAATSFSHATMAFCSALAAAVVGARKSSRTARRAQEKEAAEPQNFFQVNRRAAFGMSAAVCSVCGSSAANADYEIVSRQHQDWGVQWGPEVRAGMGRAARQVPMKVGNDGQ
eukprot:Skav232224  [mRNA]  locus=scaffold286:178498:185646:- [translate_table: standard]